MVPRGANARIYIEQLPAAEGRRRMAGSNGSFLMKRAVLLLFLASLAPLAVGRNDSSFNVRLTADSQRREGSLVRCRGNVEMASDSIVVRADEVDYHSDSGLAEARGNVRIQLLPVAPSSTSVGKMQHP